MPVPDEDADEDNPYLREPPTDFAPVEDLGGRSRATGRTAPEAIREHDRRYYVESEPLIADRTYDAPFQTARPSRRNSISLIPTAPPGASAASRWRR